MITVPQAFLQNAALPKLMVHGQNCILEKVAFDMQPDNARYLAHPALTVVRQGQLRLSTEEGNGLTLHPGQMVLLPVGVYFISDLIPYPDPFRAWVFFFEESLITEFLQDHPGPETLPEPATFEVFQTPKTLEAIMEGLLAVYKSTTTGPVTRYKLLEILHQVAEHTPSNRFLGCLQAMSLRKKHGVRGFMEQHYDKPLRVEDYAHLTGRSISTFQRDFKRQFGTSPKSWLLEKRLATARQRLTTQPDIRVGTLAQLSGYENVSHFIKVFQERYGTSPKQLQLKHRRGTQI